MEIPAANEPSLECAASSQITADLLAVIPNLRAFAVSLCGNLDRADDLVQETLVKAWSN
ncbi:MAG: sigma factor, partial [Methylocella sp.]